MTTLEARNISYRYNPKSDMVLENMSLSFDKGQLYAILGESGSGKTTLLSLLAGLDLCADGSIAYNGVDIKDINRDRYRAKNIGMIFQQFNLLHRFNAVDNILVALEISGLRNKGSKEYAKKLLSGIGIDNNKSRRRITHLSGGEQQRVAIARALSHNPDIILADEPTGSLDTSNQTAIMDILVSSAKDDNKCVIISTHSKEVADRADKIFVVSRHVKSS